ncbi:hypothetical protein SAMN05443252_10659 [Bacillus sp. OV322]|uniref:hypothetical protein n=1 Tax=Bacillus sp. OV322 TaxID=1882764 RepID=UPI0008F2B85A|nr:hypothetical protein [Bacillus sp. OV322]SFC76818.1 hypothetical protein SAMN05443252_10659 [Bacillus sp. OV322]
MGKRKQPKFKKGDTVVIIMYGTVGNITDIKYLDGNYVYEVNYSEGLYIESTLQHIFEYKGEVHYEKEQVDIDYKFIFGDLVQVDGYDRDYFKVIGFRTEIWRYKENAWEDVIYELSRVSDGEWLEAHEEELTLIADAKEADGIIEKLGLLHSIAKKPVKVDLNKTKKDSRASEQETLNTKSEKLAFIDGLLDLYNDYQLLYDMFGDEDFKQIMNIAMIKVQKAAHEVYNYGNKYRESSS